MLPPSTPSLSHFPFYAWPVDCLDPQCSGHGVCVKGECLCSPGWGGPDCESPLPACQEQCSGHGNYLPDSGTCTCDSSWTGSDCSTGEYKNHDVHYCSKVYGHLEMSLFFCPLK
jgi:hypothetical protein